jgi:capsular exopolysaccharide synthesis family protein
MSRLFDALQRSATEQSGNEYPDMLSMISALEFPAEQDEQAEPAIERVQLVADRVQQTAAPRQETAAPRDEWTDNIPTDNTPLDFPSRDIFITPASRLVVLTEPDSLAAEKFRFLGVRLRHLRQNRQLKKILVTSSIPEEGKSLVSANLAGVLARRKQRVLLIEGDLRRPVLVQQFGLRGLTGLGEWLRSSQQKVSNIYYLPRLNFWLLPAGHPPENPLELMQSGRLAELMRQLESLFDWIIVDSPPLLPLADTSVWGRLTDGTLLVAREGKTEKTALQEGVEILKKSDLLGIVLNSCTNLNHRSYYHYYSPPRDIA